MDSHIVAVIIGCEIGFWVLVFGALVVRYLARLRGLSTSILALVPILDIVLIAAVALDLHRGSEAELVHRLAGIYLGITVAFGHSIIGWADLWCAHWFADGAPPPRPPRKGPAAFRRELIAFGQWLAAAGIAAAAMLGLSVTVADSDQSSALLQIFPTLALITVVWLLAGPVWALFDLSDERHQKSR